MEETSKTDEFKKLDSVPHTEVEALVEAVHESPWRQNFHIQPVTGKLADPAGFVYHNGTYHLFYQWVPLDSREGFEYWYHVTSEELANFSNQGVKIRPDTIYDSNGALAGSAFVIGDDIQIYYTGSHKTERGRSIHNQMHAVLNARLKVRKDAAPLIEGTPEGYTDNFKNPKVWQEDDVYYMIIGAQNHSEYGRALLYSTEESGVFKLRGEVRTGLEQFGFMWENPDFFTLGDKDVLAFCPKGLDKYKNSYWNAFQSGYVVGRLYRGTLVLEHGEFYEFDHGFDFYAPQTALGKDGERILIGWMGIEESNYPTEKYEWAGCLTIPRVISLENDRIRQMPVPALENLRYDEITAEGYFSHYPRKMKDFYGDCYELIVDINENNASEIYINLRMSRKEETALIYNTEKRLFTLDLGFSGVLTDNVDGTTRSVELEEDLKQLRVYMDNSSIEIFINNGEAVMSSRIFPDEKSVGVEMSTEIGECYVCLTQYKLKPFEPEQVIYNQ